MAKKYLPGVFLVLLASWGPLLSLIVDYILFLTVGLHSGLRCVLDSPY